MKLLDWLFGTPTPPPLYSGQPASPKFPGCWAPRARPVGDVAGWMTVLRSVAERQERERRRRQRWKRLERSLPIWRRR